MSRRPALRLLLERLNWPLRLVKLCAAREYAGLIENPQCRDEALEVYYEWLENRTLESQVVSGLAVLFAVKEKFRPPYERVDAAIQVPSMLSSAMLTDLYELMFQELPLIHSGPVPKDFVVSTYFKEHLTSHVPPLFRNNLQRLADKIPFPFVEQWAFEQSTVSQATSSVSSSHPYHFFESGYLNTGMAGNFQQRQSDVFLSAYLRTLASAVDARRLSPRRAFLDVVDALPVQQGMINIMPVPKPTWIGTTPEECCADDAPLEALIRSMLLAAHNAGALKPVYLNLPVWRGPREFADLTLRAHMVSPGYSGLDCDMTEGHLAMLWPLPNPFRFEGLLPNPPIGKYLKSAATGVWAPFSLKILPCPIGLWHADLHRRGVAAPAPYCFESELDMHCHESGISIQSEGRTVGSWCTWNDHWIPVYPAGGASASASLLTCPEIEVEQALRKHAFVLGWSIELHRWTRDNDYSEFKENSRTAFFVE